MKKIALSGNSQKIELKGLDCPQNLVFSDVNVNTKIKVEVQRVGKDNIKIFVPMKIHQIAEAQRKINDIGLGIQLKPIDIDDTPTNNTITSAPLMISLDGEIEFFDINDKLVIELSDMSNAGGFLFIQGSSTKSNNIYRFLDQSFDGLSDELRLDVSKFSFLVFENDASKFPQMVERFYQKEINRDDFESIAKLQHIRFGTVSRVYNVMDDKYSLKIGSDSCIVLDVRGLETLILKDDRGVRFKFWGVKFQ